MVSFSKLAGAARSEPTPTEPEAAPVAVEAEVEQAPDPTPEPTKDVVTTTASGDLVAFNPGAIAQAINSALSVASEGGGGEGTQFPTLCINKGFSVPVQTKKFPEELFDQLPQGNKPIVGVFLGFRVEVIAWPRLYDEATGGGDQPVWSAAFGMNRAADFGLVARATKNYQFKAKDAKAGFDPDAGGPGHPRPVFQFLIYSPDVGGPIVVQTPMSYASFEEALKVLAAHTTADGALDLLNVKLAVQKKTVTTPRYSWDVYWYGVDRVAGDRAEKDRKDFEEWRSALDPADRKELLGWLAGEDRPATDDIVAKLTEAARM